MLVAHLRGLLKPAYLHGTRSIAAENLILDALELEETAKARMGSLQMEACLSPMFDPAKSATRARVGEMFKEYGSMGRASLFDTASAGEAKGSVESAEKLFYALARAGLVTEPENFNPEDENLAEAQ